MFFYGYEENAPFYWRKTLTRSYVQAQSAICEYRGSELSLIHECVLRIKLFPWGSPTSLRVIGRSSIRTRIQLVRDRTLNKFVKK